MTGIVADFIELFDPIMESPTAFLWSAFVTNFGLRVSPYVRFASQQPRLFTCNIGESATTRKSTASDVVNEFFEAALKGASVRPARLVDGFGSIEGALKLMARYKKGESDEVYTPPPTLFYLDELDPLMKRSSMPGSLGQAPLHRLFNGNSYTYPTLGNELEINDAYIAILSNATTDRFRELWSGESVDNGFLNRNVVVGAVQDPAKIFPVRLFPPAEKLARLQERTAQLVDSIAANWEPVELIMSPKALDRWTDYYRFLRMQTDPAFRRPARDDLHFESGTVRDFAPDC